MFSQFKMKPGKDQSELATVESQMMPGALQIVPGLQWASNVSQYRQIDDRVTGSLE